MSLLTPRAYHATGTLGNYVYFVGGTGPSGSLASVEILDTRTWGQAYMKNLSVSRTGFAIASAPGIGVYVAGGSTALSGGYSSVVDYYTCGNGVRFDCLSLHHH